VGGRECYCSASQSSIQSVRPRHSTTRLVVQGHFRWTYANAHAYHINSISVNSDGETFRLPKTASQPTDAGRSTSGPSVTSLPSFFGERYEQPRHLFTPRAEAHMRSISEGRSLRNSRVLTRLRVAKVQEQVCHIVYSTTGLVYHRRDLEQVSHRFHAHPRLLTPRYQHRRPRLLLLPVFRVSREPWRHFPHILRLDAVATQLSAVARALSKTQTRLPTPPYLLSLPECVC
jgi:hypothetical protein